MPNNDDRDSDYRSDQLNELHQTLDRDFEREHGYRTRKEPMLLRRGGTLRLEMQHRATKAGAR